MGEYRNTVHVVFNMVPSRCREDGVCVVNVCHLPSSTHTHTASLRMTSRRQQLLISRRPKGKGADDQCTPITLLSSFWYQCFRKTRLLRLFFLYVFKFVPHARDG